MAIPHTQPLPGTPAWHRKYPALLPMGSTYIGPPPSWDAPEPTEYDIEAHANDEILADSRRMPELLELLGEDDPACDVLCRALNANRFENSDAWKARRLEELLERARLTGYFMAENEIA